MCMPKPSHDVDFKVLFESAPQAYLILSPEWIIIAVSDAYLKVTMTTRENIIGRHLFDVFPDNPSDPEATGIRNLRASLESVMQTKQAHTMAVQKYDIRRREEDGGEYEERFWSPVNSPILAADGTLRYIVHRAEDVTEFIRMHRQGVLQSQIAEELRERANKMESEILQRSKEIQERNFEVEQINRKLEIAHKQALIALQIKSEFLANMSHEIRTPLNGILGMAESIMRSELPQHLRERVAIIQDAGTSLLSVINDILDFSKIEAGKLSLEIIEFDAERLVEGVGELLAQQAHAKNLTLATYIDPKIPSVIKGDPGRLRQVLVNLTGNAIKFSKSGEIVISAAVHSETDESVCIKFSVSDQGIGLTEAERDRLFKPFVQGDGSTTRKYGGTGLGLSICKRLVELMLGEFGIESTKGEGSTFWFKVVLSKGENQEKLSAVNDELAKLRVLLVLDEVKTRETIHNYLAAWGAKVSVADNHDEAINLLHSAKSANLNFNIVILGAKSGNAELLGVSKAIKRETKLSDTRLLLISAEDPRESENCSKLISNFDEFLLKPVKRSLLLETVNELSCKSFKRINKKGNLKKSKTGLRKDSVDATKRNASDNDNAIAKNGDNHELSDEENITHKELILVVEDHEINQKVAILLLHRMGFEAHMANNGKEAFKILSKSTHPYSLVLMDVQMPVMGGLEAARQIRKSEIGSGKHVPIIAMTAHVLEGSQEACFASGMDDYISKPIDQTILLETIEKWLPAENSDAKAKIERMKKEIGNQNKIIDLNELRSRYGHARSDALLKLFVDDTALRLAAIKQLTEERDQPALIFALHQLKGAAASLLAHGMRTSCMSFENHLSKRGLDNTEDLFEKLANEFANLQSFLQRANVDLCASITTASKPTKQKN